MDAMAKFHYRPRNIWAAGGFRFDFDGQNDETKFVSLNLAAGLPLMTFKNKKDTNALASSLSMKVMSEIFWALILNARMTIQ